jgi:uncharacterized tellurite resistance protein B-like protein
MMLKPLLEKLFAKQETMAAPGKNRLPLAICVVLLSAARADEEFAPEEREQILRVLRERFELDTEGAETLLAEAEEAEEKSGDLWRFTHEINRACDNTEKKQILEEVWRIIYSDGALAGHEDYLAHKLRDLFNLDQQQLIEAKMTVLREVRGE